METLSAGRPRLWRRAFVVAVITLALSLTGCTGPAPVTRDATVVAAVSCGVSADSTARTGRVPNGFMPVAAYLCAEEQVPEGTVPPPPSATRMTGDLTALLAALALPNDGAPASGACPAMAQIVSELWLMNRSGGAIHVHWPRDGCGFAKPGVAKALKELVDAGRVATN